jgi:hypothetical protein
MKNIQEPQTVFSYDEWLKFMSNIGAEFQPDLVEFISSIKESFIGFCKTPLIIYDGKVGTARSAVFNSKHEVLNFLKDKSCFLYSLDEFSTMLPSGEKEISLKMRYIEVEPTTQTKLEPQC